MNDSEGRKFCSRRYAVCYSKLLGIRTGCGGNNQLRSRSNQRIALRAVVTIHGTHVDCDVRGEQLSRELILQRRARGSKKEANNQCAVRQYAA